MSLVDEARLLMQGGASGDDHCPHCSAYIGMTGEWANGSPVRANHAADCPWLSLPRIVAVLEAASDLVDAATSGPYPVGGEGPMPYAEWRALVAALADAAPATP